MARNPARNSAALILGLVWLGASGCAPHAEASASAQGVAAKQEVRPERRPAQPGQQPARRPSSPAARAEAKPEAKPVEAAPPAPASSSWLDRELANWNESPRLPTAEPAFEASDRCKEQLRPTSLPEDRLVRHAGWMLVGPAQLFGKAVLVGGTTGFDAECRYTDFQYFVFSDGEFAGTLAPEPMTARTDGALVEARLLSEDRVTVRFARYGEKDKPCCPSGDTWVSYRLELREEEPVLVPAGKASEPPEPSQVTEDEPGKSSEATAGKPGEPSSRK